MSAVSTSASRTTTRTIEVIDPCNRTGKIVVPTCYVSETRGIHEQNRPKDAKDLSLCLLFQKGRCNAGPRCHQIHVEPSFVEKLRAQATAGSACCALHGDFQSASYLTVAPKSVEVFTNGVPAHYALVSFGRTSAFDTLLANATSNTIRVNASKICRLHSQGRCKFGKDCKNIHLCPKAKPAGSPVKPAPLAPSWGAAAPTATATTTPKNKMTKSNLRLELSVTKSELDSTSFCGMSSCPDTPEAGKSIRSSSMASSHMNLSPSPAPSSSVSSAGGDSPKEFGLFGRTVSASPAPVPIQKMGSPAPTPLSESSFDALFAMPMLSVQAHSPSFEPSKDFELTASLIAADIAGAVVSPSWTQ